MIPLPHTGLHTLPRQSSPVAQAMPQPAQCASSFAVSTQPAAGQQVDSAPLQTRPAATPPMSGPQTHAPAAQLSEGPHEMPQLPQFSVSVPRICRQSVPPQQTFCSGPAPVSGQASMPEGPVAGPHVHWPPTHISIGPHGLLHSPQ